MSDPGPFSAGETFEQMPGAEVQAPQGGAALARPRARSLDPPTLDPNVPRSRIYRRYHIETRLTPDVVPLPPKFQVKVRKHRLIAMVVQELIAYKGNLPVTLSRPCIYGVFSRPVGGLAPREELCVGCLRCTVQYPHIVQIQPHPKRQRLGDSFVTPESVDTLLNEARTGRVPVRGAGYRGTFGGTGWDSLWTDMSEIVRPTRDGIHGREFISTAIDIGEIPAYLQFDGQGGVAGVEPRVITLQVPFLFEVPGPAATHPDMLLRIVTEAARQVETLALIPLSAATRLGLAGPHVALLVTQEAWGWLDALSWSPRLVVLDGWDRERYDALRRRCAESIVAVRVPMDTDVLELVRHDVRLIYLAADYHGYVGDRFAMDLILRAHQRLVEAGVREEVTLIGGGGIILAEHMPKAIICGLDAVTLDTALAVALQARFDRECLDRETASLSYPHMSIAWGVQRVKNLAAAWRDQLLEMLGAMGLREVRRLRGEVGRAMFQQDLEREVFG